MLHALFDKAIGCHTFLTFPLFPHPLAGDRIVIASSSVYASDVDEANITAVTVNPAANTTTLTLDTPLTYTHLGELISGIPGDNRGTVVDL